MNSVLTAEERRLIDDAIAAGKVTRVPRGASSYAGYVFDPNRNAVVNVETAAGNPVKPRTTRSRRPNPALEARRIKVRLLHAEGLTDRAIAERLDVTAQTVFNDRAALGLPVNKGAVAATDGKAEARRARVRHLHGQGLTMNAIAAELGVGITRVKNDLRALGLTPNPQTNRRREPRNGDRAARVKAERAVAAIRDRRRFKTTPPPTGDAARIVDPGAEGSMFPSRVFDPLPGEAVLKDGAHNCKIGGDVSVGRLKGARIFTLSLEERATCPRSCFHWRSCYGNAMNNARRWRHGPALEARLREEVAALCVEHRIVLIRLHVLGDFYSPEYVGLWRDLLLAHANLTVFGFTAWSALTPIGGAVASLRSDYPRRFMVRESGRSGRWGSWTIDFPTERKTMADGVVCPEQRDAMDGGERSVHCGSCGVCWSTDAPVVFVEH